MLSGCWLYAAKLLFFLYIYIYSLASLDIDYPMLFEIHNDAADRVSHCGVLEFVAEEGMIYMPNWVGTSLRNF